MTQLGKLQKVDLRSVWKHEATDFSAWLAKPENLDAVYQEVWMDGYDEGLYDGLYK